MSGDGKELENSLQNSDLLFEEDDPFFKVEPQILNQRQVAQAMKMVNQRHPLRKLPVGDVLPYLQYFEPILPSMCIDWINGTGSQTDDIPDTPSMIKRSETLRKKAIESIKGSGVFEAVS